MNNFEDKFNAYIKANPRQSLLLILTLLCFAWVSVVCILGIVLYLGLSKLARMQWWLMLVIGFCMALGIVMINIKYSAGHMDFAMFMIEGFRCNFGFWKLFFTCHGFCALTFMYKYMLSYVAGFPLLFAGILSAVDLIQDSPHRCMIDALQKGELINVQKEITEKKIVAALKKLNDVKVDGTILDSVFNLYG